MTRFRFVSLCLVTFLCLSIASPAMANAPYLVPAGLVETLSETARGVIEHVLAWFGGGQSIGGPEIVTSG